VIVDLSHPIVAEMAMFPGLAGPRLETVVSRAESAAGLAGDASFEIDAVTLVGNTGTYLDAPYHFHADRADIAGLPLQRLSTCRSWWSGPMAGRRSARPTSATRAGCGAGRCWCTPAGPGTHRGRGSRLTSPAHQYVASSNPFAHAARRSGVGRR
jgi:hypothetical protein